MSSSKSTKKDSKPKTESDVKSVDLASFFKLGTVVPKSYEKIVAAEDNDGYLLPKSALKEGIVDASVVLEPSEQLNEQKLSLAHARLQALLERKKKRKRDSETEDEDEKIARAIRAKQAKSRESKHDSDDDSAGWTSESEEDIPVDDHEEEEDLNEILRQHEEEMEAADQEGLDDPNLTPEERKALKKRLVRKARRHRKALERAEQRRKQLGYIGDDGEAVNSDDEKMVQKKKWNKAELAERNTRTIFVGNVPINAKQKDMAKLFSEYGKVESVRFRNLTVMNPDKRRKSVIKAELHPERDSMIAYVVFETQASVKHALKANGVEFGGKHLRIDSAEKSELSSSDFENTVYVSCLPFAAEEEDLWEIFSRCGKIVSVRIIRDEHFKVAKGFGYVKFTSKDAVLAALKLNLKITYKDKLLHVSRAIDKDSASKMLKNKKQTGQSLMNKYKSKTKKLAKK